VGWKKKATEINFFQRINFEFSIVSVCHRQWSWSSLLSMVVVIIVVVLVQTARSGHWRGKGAWQVGAGGRRGTGGRRNWGHSWAPTASDCLVCHFASAASSLSIPLARSPSHSLPRSPSPSSDVSPSLSVLRLLPLPHVALSKDSCSNALKKSRFYD